MPTGFGLRPGRESAGRATEPYRLRASPRLYYNFAKFATRLPMPATSSSKRAAMLFPSVSLLNSSPVRRGFQDGDARTTDSALHAHRRPLFRNPPSTATSKAVSTRRVQCPRTPGHRAVLAPSTTYRPNTPESATASERYAARHPTETAISGQAPSVARREPASTRRVQRPREPARYAPSEGGQEDAPPRNERRPRPRNGRRHAT